MDNGGSINWDDEESLREGLTLIALLGIQDPVRAEVPEAIAKVIHPSIIP
jgi:magnesium-transporting ATPase (P-type)